jgi:dolichyl-phosphate-mannose--protein O-mannosyl transferase
MKLWSIAFLLFCFAVVLRLWNFGAVGRSSDETALVVKGYTIIELLRRGDFGNPFWYNQANGHPLLTSYGYGLASYKDFVRYDKNKTTEDTYFSAWKGGPEFSYDLTYTRLVSVIISSLSVVLIFFIGARYFSMFSGIVAGIILAMLPHFLGYSQLVTMDSWVVPFFTASAFSYFLYLEKGRLSLLILTGILTGLTLEVKESTGIIFILYIGTYLIWRLKKTAGIKSISPLHLLTISAIGIGTYFAIWPMILIH